MKLETETKPETQTELRKIEQRQNSNQIEPKCLLDWRFGYNGTILKNLSG